MVDSGAHISCALPFIEERGPGSNYPLAPEGLDVLPGFRSVRLQIAQHILADGLEHTSDKLHQAVELLWKRCLHRLNRLNPSLRFTEHPGNDRVNEIFFAFEVLVEGFLAHAKFGGYFIDGDAGKSINEEPHSGMFDDSLFCRILCLQGNHGNSQCVLGFL